MSFEGISRQPKKEEEGPDQVAELAIAAEQLKRKLEASTSLDTRQLVEKEPELGEREPDFGDMVRKLREGQ